MAGQWAKENDACSYSEIISTQSIYLYKLTGLCPVRVINFENSGAQKYSQPQKLLKWF
jgi:hypothetical protein